MANLTVKPVQTRREQKQFVQFPWTLYQDDPNWIPPLHRNLEELVGFRPHPFHDVADVRTFLATREGEVCGRIAAIVNHTHNKHYNERRGFFGFFECASTTRRSPMPCSRQFASGLPSRTSRRCEVR